MKSQALHTLRITPVWREYKRCESFLLREGGVVQFLDTSWMQLLQPCRLLLRNGLLWLVGWCVLWGLRKIQVTHACFYDNFHLIPCVQFPGYLYYWILILTMTTQCHSGGERTASPSLCYCMSPFNIAGSGHAQALLSDWVSLTSCSLKLNWMLKIKQAIWWRVH